MRRDAARFSMAADVAKVHGSGSRTAIERSWLSKRRAHFPPPIPLRVASRNRRRTNDINVECERGDSNLAETITNDKESRGLAVVSMS
jgi:hypothetical protein